MIQIDAGVLPIAKTINVQCRHASTRAPPRLTKRVVILSVQQQACHRALSMSDAARAAAAQATWKSTSYDGKRTATALERDSQ